MVNTLRAFSVMVHAYAAKVLTLQSENTTGFISFLLKAFYFCSWFIFVGSVFVNVALSLSTEN